jgi:hypothetical protein
MDGLLIIFSYLLLSIFIKSQNCFWGSEKGLGNCYSRPWAEDYSLIEFTPLFSSQFAYVIREKHIYLHIHYNSWRIFYSVVNYH